MIDPFGLVSKAGVWYVVARSGDDYRTFRVDRITRTLDTSEQFTRPADFDLDAYWNDATRRMEAPSLHYWITLEVRPEQMPSLLAMTEHEVIDAQRCIVRINYGSAGEAAWRLFVWNDAARVLEPPEFVEALIERAKAILSKYAR